MECQWGVISHTCAAWSCTRLSAVRAASYVAATADRVKLREGPSSSVAMKYGVEPYMYKAQYSNPLNVTQVLVHSHHMLQTLQGALLGCIAIIHIINEGNCPPACAHKRVIISDSPVWNHWCAPIWGINE